MDQAVAKDVMDVEAAASFVVSIIIIVPMPPKIIAPPLEQSVTTASPEPSSSLHCQNISKKKAKKREYS